MTRRPYHAPSAAIWITLFVGAVMFWAALFAAAVAETYAWNHETHVTIQPTAQPGAVAEIVFLNTEIHGQFAYAFDLTLDGLTVSVAMEINAQGGAADRMTVTPPEGYIAVPESVLVPENGAGVVHIFEDAIG